MQQARDGRKALFTFLTKSHEGKGVIITSNLVFSQWDQILKYPMTTIAARVAQQANDCRAFQADAVAFTTLFPRENGFCQAVLVVVFVGEISR